MKEAKSAEKAWTVLEIIDLSRDHLASKGFDNARLESEMLLGHALSLSRVELYLNFDRQLKRQELSEYRSMLLRRLGGEPVQYVTGTCAFMFSEFEVNRAVLIPRPETEALVERVIGLVGAMPKDEATDFIIADLGTGSGVIAATLALKFEGARVIATDTSGEALKVAARNARRAGVEERVEFSEGTLTEPLERAGLEGKISVIVSNPPYVPSGEIDSLPREIRDFEPRIALDGGPDGLDCIRAIAKEAPRYLNAAGMISLEVGDGQAEAAVALLRSSMSCSQVFPDYSGRDRIVVGSKADVLPADHTNPVDRTNPADHTNPVDRTNPVDHTRSEGSDGQDNH